MITNKKKINRKLEDSYLKQYAGFQVNKIPQYLHVCDHPE